MKSVRFVCTCLVLASTLAPAQSNPVPLISQPLVPTSTAPGGAAFTLTVKGTGFVSGSVVNWNGVPRTTTFVSGAQLTANILAADIAIANTGSVTVINPAPGGGTSNVVFFPVHAQGAIAFSQTDFATGVNPHSVITGDFNSDGKLDLVTADRADDTVSVLLGNGDGTFQARIPYATAAGPLALVAADFNGDGKIDLAVADQYANEVSILLGNGDGTFQGAVEYATGNEPLSLTLGDFNKDGKLDLAVTNGSDNTVSILLGNGDGTFQVQVPYPTGARPFPIVTGDFNGDGILDLAIGNQDGNSISILLGNGDGTFQSQVTYAAGSQVYSLVTADFNGDGRLDLVAANFTDNTISVLLGNGDGTFQNQVTYPTASGPHTLAAADFNGDGKLDLAVADENANEVSILLGNGDGTFQPHVDYGAGSGAVSPAVGDFNQDGRLDLAVANFNDDTVSILLQVATISLSPTSLNFGDQVDGTSSPPQTVTLTNTGGASLSIGNIVVSGANAADFTQSNTCGSSLAAGGSCTISVTFTPTQIGAEAAAVTITDSSPGSPQSVPLTGTGVGAPVVTLSPPSVTFPNQYVGTSGLPQTVTLTNSGTLALAITNVTTSPADFGVLSACGSSVPVGASCSIGVFFDPTASGTRTGTLTVIDNASGSRQTVTLSGTGQDFSVDPSGSSSVTVAPGQTASYTVSIAPGGGFNQTVTLSCSGAPAQSACSLSSSTVALNGSAPASVTITVTTAGASASLAYPAGFSSGGNRLTLWFALSGLAGLVLLGGLGAPSRKWRDRGLYALAFLCLLSLPITWSSCGGSASGNKSGGGGGTPAGTYNLTVTGSFTSGSTTLTHNTKLTLVVQ